MITSSSTQMSTKPTMPSPVSMPILSAWEGREISIRATMVEGGSCHTFASSYQSHDFGLFLRVYPALLRRGPHVRIVPGAHPISGAFPL